VCACVCVCVRVCVCACVCARVCVGVYVKGLLLNSSPTDSTVLGSAAGARNGSNCWRTQAAALALAVIARREVDDVLGLAGLQGPASAHSRQSLSAQSWMARRVEQLAGCWTGLVRAIVRDGGMLGRSHCERREPTYLYMPLSIALCHRHLYGLHPA
jgi:hypothetical protein